MDYTQFPNISIPPVEGEYLYHDGRKEKNYDNYITTVISSEGTIIDNCYGHFSSSVEIIKQPKWKNYSRVLWIFLFLQ